MSKRSPGSAEPLPPPVSDGPREEEVEWEILEPLAMASTFFTQPPSLRQRVLILTPVTAPRAELCSGGHPTHGEAKQQYVLSRLGLPWACAHLAFSTVLHLELPKLKGKLSYTRACVPWTKGRRCGCTYRPYFEKIPPASLTVRLSRPSQRHRSFVLITQYIKK